VQVNFVPGFGADNNASSQDVTASRK
jgi:hypothetical protein